MRLSESSQGYIRRCMHVRKLERERKMKKTNKSAHKRAGERERTKNYLFTYWKNNLIIERTNERPNANYVCILQDLVDNITKNKRTRERERASELRELISALCVHVYMEMFVRVCVNARLF